MKDPIFLPLREQYQSENLPNGLTVTIFQKSGFGECCAVLAVRFGEGDVRYVRNGHSHSLSAHAAFFMSQFLAYQAESVWKEEVPFSDARMEAYVTEDLTVFHLTCRRQFEKCLSLLLKNVTVPQFTQENLDRVRILAVQRMDTMKKDPFWQLQWQLQRGLYGVQLPLRDDFAEITLDEMEHLHRDFYQASNFALCIAGDVDSEHIFQLASASVPAGDGKRLQHKATAPEEDTETGQEKAITMDVQETSFLLGFRAIPEDSLRQRVLGMLSMQAFAGETSPLCQRLNNDDCLTSCLRAEWHADARKTYFTFCGSSPVPSHVAEEIMSEAIRISWQGLDCMNFARAKRALYGKKIMKLDHFQNLCVLQAKSQLFNFQWMLFPEILQDIKKDDVEEMLRECITDSQSFLSVVHPKGVY